MAAIPTDNLRAYFSLNETSGTTFADDGTGTYTADFTFNSGHPEFLSGSACVDGGTCLNLSTGQGGESNGGAASTSLMKPSINKTLAVWLKPTSGTSWRQMAGQHDGMKITKDGSGNFVCQVKKTDGNVNDVDFGTAASLQDEWHFYVCIWDYDNEKIGMSLDGGTITWSSALGLKDNTNPLQYSGLGGRTKTSDLFGEMAVQHLGVYEKVLSDAEIEQYMDATNGTESTPPAASSDIIYFNATFSTGLNDHSEYNHTLTSVSGASQTNITVGNRIGVLNLSATSSDRVTATLIPNITSMSIMRWEYYVNQPSAGNVQWGYDIYNSGTDRARMQYATYCYNPSWYSSGGEISTSTSSSGCVQDGAWYFVVEQYNGSDYTFWLNGDDYTTSTTGTGDLLLATGHTITLGAQDGGGYNYEGYMDDFIISSRSNYTTSDIESLYQAGVRGTPPVLDIVVENVSINADLSYKYNFSHQNNTYNMSGTIPYAFSINNVGTNDTQDFNVSTYIDGQLICDTRMNLTAGGSYTVYCNISKELGYRTGAVVVDSYDEIVEDTENNNDNRIYIDWNDFLPLPADWTGSFGDHVKNTSSGISYTAYNAMKDFDGNDDFNLGWGIDDVDPRGKKAYGNAWTCFVNDYEQGAKFYCDKAINHLDGWLALQNWGAGDVQAVHEWNFVVKTYKMMLPNLTKAQAINYSTQISRIHNELFAHTDVRPDLDLNTSFLDNGKGFGSGMGSAAWFMMGEDVNNPSLYWYNPAEYSGTDTYAAWNARIEKHISAEDCAEGTLYCNYAKRHLGEYLAKEQHDGDPFGIVNKYNDEICSFSEYFINNLLEFENFAIGKDGALARWTTYGDSYYDVTLGNSDAIGISMVHHLASACNEEAVKRGVVTLTADIHDRDTHNTNRRPLQAVYSYYNLSDYAAYTQSEMQENFGYYDSPVWDDLLVNRFADTTTKDLHLQFRGGDTADYGHPFAHFDIYGFYKGIEFLGFPQVSFNDDVRLETHTNTLSFSNDTTSHGYVSSCTAQLNQYYGGANNLDMSLYPFDDDGVMDSSCQGTQYGKFVGLDSELVSNVMTQPYDVSTEQQKRLNFVYEDVLIDVWLLNATSGDAYFNYNSISDEVSGSVNGNTISLSNGTVNWNISTVYSSETISAYGGTTTIVPNGEKTSSNPVASFYNRYFQTMTVNGQEVAILAHKFYNVSHEQTVSSTSSNGDEGVLISNGTRNVYVYFDTNKDGNINAFNFSTDAEILAININGTDTYMVSDASSVYEDGELIFNGSSSSFMSTYNSSAYVDTVPPVISAVLASSITTTTGDITWTTDENATSKVYYGTTGAYGLTSSTAGYRTSHSESLSGLVASTRYFYVVESCDSNGNCANNTQKYFDTDSVSGGGGSGGGVSGDGVSTITFETYELVTDDELSDVSYQVEPAAWYSNADYYMVIIADSLTSSGWTGLGHTVEQLNSTTWKINASGTYEVQRAKLMKALFFGTDGTDPRATTSLTNVASIYTNDIRDTGKIGLYADVYFAGDTFGSYGTRHLYYNYTTNSGVNSSVWWSYGKPAIENNFFETDTTSYDRSNQDYFRISGENNNCVTFALAHTSQIYSGGISGCNHDAIYADIIWLASDGIIDDSDMNQATYNITNYNTNHSIPAFTLAYNTTSGSINLSVGNYTVTGSKNTHYSVVQNFTVDEDDDDTVAVLDMYDTLLSLTVIDAISLATITGGDQYLSVTDGASYSESYTVTNGVFSVPLTSSEAYDFTGSADNYAYNYLSSSVSSMTDSLNISLYANNSIFINVYDSNNGTALDNYSITMTSDLNIYTDNAGVGTYQLNETSIASGVYRLVVEKDGYLNSEYVITMTAGSYQFLNAYLYTGSEAVIFSLADEDNGNAIENATVSMFKILNGSLININSKLSDITGRVQFGYNTGDYYSFIVVAEGYESKSFVLNPVLFSSYNILLSKSSATVSNQDYLSILIEFNGDTFYINETNSLDILIYSPDGSIEDYIFNITTEDDNQIYTGTSATGESFQYNFTLPTSPSEQTVVINYCYDLTIGAQRCFKNTYNVIGSYDEGSFLSQKDNTFGLGLFERILIATIFAVFIAGIAGAVAGALAGAGLGLLIMGFLTFTGFIPLWAVLPSILVGVVLIMGRSE